MGDHEGDRADPAHRRYREPDPAATPRAAGRTSAAAGGTGPHGTGPHGTGPHGTGPAQLPRGDVTEGVVRIGGTVRRPHQPQSLAVAGYLDHLERVSFPGSPRYLGRDAEGRDVLTYLDGTVAGDPPEAWAADERLLVSVAGLVRRLHDASTGYGEDRGFAAPEGSTWGRDLVRLSGADKAELAALPAQPEPELVSHLDVTAQNVVVRNGVAVGLIDFDLAGPTTRLADAYNTAMWWVPLRPPEDVWPAWRGVDQPARLRLFADAYGLTVAQRMALPDLAVTGARRTWVRMRATARSLGGGWARMWDEGVGDAIRRREAWLRENRARLFHVLLDGTVPAHGSD